VVVQPVSGKYAEAVLRGSCYFATIGAAGAAPGTAIGTTAFISLWNPLGSGRTLRVLRATLGYISGTIGAGAIFYAINRTSSATAPTGGTVLANVNAFLGYADSSAALAGTAQTLVATPVAGEIMASSGPILATSVVQPYQIVDDIDGRYLIAPGNGLSLQFVGGAGTVPLLSASFFWEEVSQGQE